MSAHHRRQFRCCLASAVVIAVSLWPAAAADASSYSATVSGTGGTLSILSGAHGGAVIGSIPEGHAVQVSCQVNDGDSVSGVS